MYHRRESNGPVERRDCPELEMTSLLHSLPDGSCRSATVQGDRRFDEADIANAGALHGAPVDDIDDVRRYQNHTDDIDAERAIGMLVSDMRAKAPPSKCRATPWPIRRSSGS